MSVVPHLAEAGETAPSGTKTYSCPDHGQTIGAHHCAVRHCRTSEVRSTHPLGWIPVVLDPTISPGAIEVRDGACRVAKIENVGFGDATAAQIGTQELNR